MPERPTAASAATRRLPRVATLLVFGLAGLLLVTTALAARGTDLRAARSKSLPELVQQRAVALEQQQARVDALAASVADQTASSGGSQEAAVRRSLAGVAPAAAMTPVVGPGVEVVLDDAPRSLDRDPGNATPDDLVVHQQDVEAVVNAMWRAGADGVSVMGRRLSSTSAVRCVGNTLLLDGRVYSPPFRIAAVGDTDRIESELDGDPQVQVYREYADLFGLGYEVAVQPEITLPAYAGPLPGSAS